MWVCERMGGWPASPHDCPPAHPLSRPTHPHLPINPPTLPASQPAGGPAGRPASRPSSQPASQQASQPASLPPSRSGGQPAIRPVRRAPSQTVSRRSRHLVCSQSHASNSTPLPLVPFLRSIELPAEGSPLRRWQQRVGRGGASIPKSTV